ncbi:hypothetical protein VUR80DRAFT_2215 [Thermomyces stellatus]
MCSLVQVVDSPIFAVIEKALAYLRTVDIHGDRVHAESAPGRFETILPAAEPLDVVDRLLYVREVVQQYAFEEGYTMTLYPKRFPFAAGNASYEHISLRGKDADDTEVHESAYTGILKNLRAMCAFTHSTPASYGRAVDGCWGRSAAATGSLSVSMASRTRTSCSRPSCT